MGPSLDTKGIRYRNFNPNPLADLMTFLSIELPPNHILYMSLCIAVCIFGWFYYHGDPRKHDYSFVYPPKSVCDVVMSILYNGVTEALVASATPVIVLAVGSYIYQFTFGRNYCLDFWTCIHTYLTCVLMICFLGISSEMRNLYLVQRERFRISSDPLQVSFSKTLGEALASPSNHTRQLAYYDLRIITDSHEPRIYDFLKLTHPGRHPYAWNSVLTPILNFIGGATMQFKDFATVVRREIHAETEQPSNQQTSETNLFLGSTEKLEKQKNYPGLRDMVAPVQTKVTFPPVNDKGQVVVQALDLAAQLAAAPSIILNATLAKIRAEFAAWYAKTFSLKLPENKLNPKVREILTQQRVLIWATQIIVGICDFSITKDLEGVISSTVAQIIPVHLDLYCTLEELVEELRPVRGYIWRGYLQRVVNLMTEYKKSLVFFYVNYAPHAEILRIHTATVKQLKRVCSVEFPNISSGGGEASPNNRNSMETPTLFNGDY